MGYAWVSIINLLVQLITWGVIIHVILGIFLGPFHPAREFTSRIFEPLLAPIRQILPQAGMMDFSPMVLIILVQLLGMFLMSLLG
jgi:YggT family protein